MLAGHPLWIWIAAINSVLAAAILLYNVDRQKRTAPTQGSARIDWAHATTWVSVIAIAIAFVIAPNVGTVYSLGLLWLLIPLCEEITFRLGVNPLLTLVVHSRFYASYFTALTFALLHTSAAAGYIECSDYTTMIGPFLLSWSCDFIFQSRRNLIPCIALHSACNIFVFSVTN